MPLGDVLDTNVRRMMRAATILQAGIRGKHDRSTEKGMLAAVNGKLALAEIAEERKAAEATKQCEEAMERLRKVEDLFYALDTNGDGTIDEHELGPMLRQTLASEKLEFAAEVSCPSHTPRRAASRAPRRAARPVRPPEVDATLAYPHRAPMSGGWRIRQRGVRRGGRGQGRQGDVRRVHDVLQRPDR